MSLYREGVARLLSGDSFETPVSSWHDHGESRGRAAVAFQDGALATGRVDRLGRAPLVDGIHHTGAVQRWTVPLLEEQVEQLVRTIPGSVVLSASAKKALGLGRGTSKVTPRAFALVPLEEWTSGDPWWGSENVRWLFQAYCYVTGDFVRQPPEGEDTYADNVFEVVVMQVDSATEHAGGIGPVWLGGYKVLGAGFVFDAAAAEQQVVGTVLKSIIGTDGASSRNGLSWYTDENGVLRECPANLAPVYGMGLVPEPQRTNHVTYSDDFTQWEAVNAPTITGGQADPMGGMGACLIADNDVGAQYVRTSVSLTGDGAKAVSIFLKVGVMQAPQGSQVALEDTTAAINRLSAVVTWSAGVPVVAITTGQYLGYESWGSGWYRLLFTAVGVVAANSHRFVLRPAWSTVEQGNVYAFRAQVEDAPVPSSGIKTTGAPVTRPAGYSVDATRIQSGAHLKSIPAATNKARRGCLWSEAVGATTISGWTTSGDAAAVLSIVSDAAELRAAGLHHIAYDAKVLKLDNSAGATDAVANGGGTVGVAATTHTASVYCRGTGAGKIGFSLVGGGGSAVTPFTSGYIRRSFTNAPANAGAYLQIHATAGSVVYFVLPQLEEGSVPTPPIPNPTAGSLTRLASDLSWAYADAFDATVGLTLQLEIDPITDINPAATTNPLEIGDGTSVAGRFRLGLRRTSASGFQAFAANGTTEASINLALVAGQVNRVTIALDPAAGGTLRAWIGDTEQGAGQALAMPATGTLAAGSKIVSKSAYCNVYRFAVAKGVQTPAAMQGLSVAS